MYTFVKTYWIDHLTLLHLLYVNWRVKKELLFCLWISDVAILGKCQMLLLIMPFPSTIFKELFLLHSILLTFRSLLFSQGFIPISLFFIYLFFLFCTVLKMKGLPYLDTFLQSSSFYGPCSTWPLSMSCKLHKCSWSEPVHWLFFDSSTCVRSIHGFQIFYFCW